MTALPPDWREQLVDMIVAADPPSPERARRWFRGGTGLDPSGQIGVYREQFLLRLGMAVSGAYPGLAHLVGDDMTALVEAYLAVTPSHTWTLDQVGDALPDWLEASGAPADQMELALVDRAVQRAFSAGDGRAPDPQTLGPETRLGHAPSLGVLQLGAPWHTYRAAVHAGRSPPHPEPREVHLAIYRVGTEVRHRELEPDEARVLRAFAGGRTLVEAVEAVVADGADVAALQASLGTWFRRFAERRLLVAVADGAPSPG